MKSFIEVSNWSVMNETIYFNSSTKNNSDRVSTTLNLLEIILGTSTVMLFAWKSSNSLQGLRVRWPCVFLVVHARRLWSGTPRDWRRHCESESRFERCTYRKTRCKTRKQSCVMVKIENWNWTDQPWSYYFGVRNQSCWDSIQKNADNISRFV